MNRLLLLATLLLASAAAYAQAPPTGGPATNIPIDGGASLLLASGVAYGLRQLRQRQKKNTAR